MTRTFKIDGMSCGHCIMAVKKELTRINLENSDVKIGEAVINFNESVVTESDIVKAIGNAGYKVVSVN